MRTHASAGLKSRARTVLAGKWTFITGAFLFEMMLNMALEMVIELAFPMQISGGFSIPHMLCTIIAGLLSVIISAGSTYLYLNVARGRQYQLRDLFFSFSHQPERMIGWFFAILGITMLFSLIPAVLLAFALVSGSRAGIAASVAVLLICIIGFFMILLRYIMVPFLYADAPWKTTRELMHESSELMKGQKSRYFYLQLTYLGLILLALLSFGIGFIWVSPYISMTNTQFYLELKQEI